MKLEEEACNADDPHTFEKMLQMVGTTGKKNLLIIFFASYSGLITGTSAFSYVFLGGNPKFHCQNDHLNSANWTFEEKIQISTPFKTDGKLSSCEMYDAPYDVLNKMSYKGAKSYIDEIKSNLSVISCAHRKFEENTYTTVTEWDLVCERRVLYSSTQSVIQGGKLIGSLIFGHLSDTYGRKNIYTLTSLCYIAASFSISLSQGIWTFIILRLITAFFGMGVILSGYVLCMEMILEKNRPVTAGIFNVPWGSSLFYVAGIAYFVRTWYYLQILIAAPTLMLLLAIWYLPESPRWLIINERYDEAIRILNEIAISNGKKIPNDDKLMITMNKIYKEHKAASESMHTKSNGGNLLSKVTDYFKESFVLIIDKRFRWMTLAVFFGWFSVSLVYYGVSLGNPSPGSSNNEYLFAAIGGVMELLSSLIMYLCILYLGRKYTLISYFLICGISILIAMTLIIIEKNIEYIGIQWTLFMLGRLTISGSFGVLYLYTTELYPTSYRAMALGDSSVAARVGSIFSSYINDILGQVINWAPSALFGAFSAITAFVIMTLPQTKHKEMPDYTSRKEKRNGIDNLAIDSTEF